MNRLLRMLAVVAVLQTGLALGFSSPAYALSGGSGTMIEKGFDSCQDPTSSHMQTWWTSSPYFWLGTYIGGVSMSCTQPNLSSGYLNTVNSQGWSFEFIWVGPQAPGTGYAHQFSSTPSTAYTQGQNEASSAYNKLLSLGIGNSAANTAIVYDLDAVNTTYQSAVNSFISGWINILHISPAQKAGVYGSVCGSNLNALRNLSPYPDFIWGAYYNGNPSTSNLYTGTCGVTSGNWINHQRLKQYNNTHNETWGGVTLSVDDDCANGPTDPTGVGTDTACE